MISFIITAYNRPLALRTCLSSIIQQTNTDWEAIVMDNGDSTMFYEMDDGRIGYQRTRAASMTLIPNPSHHHYSLYKATEIGVDATTGDWLCFPNDDSYYCPWFLERMLKAATEKQWDLAYCDIVMGGPKEHHLLEARPRLCCVDKTNFIMRREWFQGFAEGYGDNYPQADGYMIEELVRRGIRHGRIPEVLVVHN